MPGKGKPFQKGKAPKSPGRPVLTEEEKALRKLTKAEVVELASLILKGNRQDLEKLTKNDQTSIFQAMIAAVAVKIIKTGDMDALDKLLNRLIGKVKEELEVSGDGLKPQVMLVFEDNGRSTAKK